MDYTVETPEMSASLINSSFINKIEQGMEKEAAENATAFIREKLRQDAAVREIMKPVPITSDELDRDENTDQPKKIIDKEPDSVATFTQFNGSGPRTWFKGKRYAIYFGKVESQRFTKNIFELMTYTSDIRKILSDNSVKDMGDQEDKKFKETLDAIITADTGHVQSTSGDFKAATFVTAMQAMLDRKLPIGKMLMTKSMFLNALDLPATSVGDDIAKRHFDSGIETTQKLWGIPTVTTIKGDIYGASTPWLFAPQAPDNFLGNFYTLQDATLYLEKKADIIQFWSYEALGLGIGNRLAIQKITIT